MMRAYLAGPMTGKPDLNIPLFNRVAAHLRGQGFDIQNPAEINAEADAKFQALHPFAQECLSRMHWRDCMRRDIAALMTCDAIILLPGWEHSKGARLEESIAANFDMQRHLAASLLPVGFDLGA